MSSGPRDLGVLIHATVLAEDFLFRCPLDQVILSTRSVVPEIAMGMLMTICPTTGREIETGVETDKPTMARVNDFVSRVRCPACLSEHMVSKAQCWVCETIGGAGALSPSV
jgi:hypothetical protein